MAKYKKEIVERICSYIRDGDSQRDAAKKAGISEDTFYDWMKLKSEFSESVKKAHEDFRQTIVGKLEATLYRKAQGYEVTEIDTEYINGKDGKPTIKSQKKKVKHIQPDTGAIIFALTNLAPEKWHNKHNQEISEGNSIEQNDMVENTNLTEQIEDKIRKALNNQNRYSPDLEICISMAAGSYHAFLMALKEVQSLKSACTVEISREGNERSAPHPAFRVLKDTQEMVRRSLCELGLTVKTLATDEGDIFEDMINKVESVDD